MRLLRQKTDIFHYPNHVFNKKQFITLRKSVVFFGAKHVTLQISLKSKKTSYHV